MPFSILYGIDSKLTVLYFLEFHYPLLNINI